MKYYLKYIESIDKFTFACYSNDELLFEKRINPISSVLVEISECRCDMNENIFGVSCILSIRKNSDFYFICDNKKIIKLSYKSFITTLKDIINGEN